MSLYGKEIDSEAHWESEASDYIAALTGQYHFHRLSMIRKLIPDELYSKGKRIFDFGCGDAVMFPEFLASGAAVSGIDISKTMVDAANHRLKELGYSGNLAKEAKVDCMRTLPSDCMDAICF